MTKFEIFKSEKDYQLYFRLKATNGEIILQSEAYTSKAMCENGISSVKINSQYYYNFDKKTAINGQPFFVLKAANGQTIGKSQMYSSAQARDNGIESVKENAPKALTYDLT